MNRIKTLLSERMQPCVCQCTIPRRPLRPHQIRIKTPPPVMSSRTVHNQPRTTMNSTIKSLASSDNTKMIQRQQTTIQMTTNSRLPFTNELIRHLSLSSRRSRYLDRPLLFQRSEFCYYPLLFQRSEFCYYPLLSHGSRSLYYPLLSHGSRFLYYPLLSYGSRSLLSHGSRSYRNSMICFSSLHKLAHKNHG